MDDLHKHIRFALMLALRVLLVLIDLQYQLYNLLSCLHNQLIYQVRAWVYFCEYDNTYKKIMIEKDHIYRVHKVVLIDLLHLLVYIAMFLFVCPISPMVNYILIDFDDVLMN